MRRITEWLTPRHILGALLFVYGGLMAGSELPPDPSPGGGVIIRIPDWSSVFLAVPLVIVGALLWSRKLAEAFSKPFTGFIDSLFLGRGNGGIPPVTLRLARSFRADFRYDEAIEECRRQLEYHPRSFELWEEMVLAALDGGRFDEAEGIVAEAATVLHGPELQKLRDLMSKHVESSSARERVAD